jgi:hypothetical protein
MDGRSIRALPPALLAHVRLSTLAPVLGRRLRLNRPSIDLTMEAAP